MEGPRKGATRSPYCTVSLLRLLPQAQPNNGNAQKLKRPKRDRARQSKRSRSRRGSGGCGRVPNRLPSL